VSLHRNSYSFLNPFGSKKAEVSLFLHSAPQCCRSMQSTLLQQTFLHVFLNEAWIQAEFFGLLLSILTPEWSCGLKSNNTHLYFYSSLSAELSSSPFSSFLLISPLLLWNSPKMAIILKEVIMTSFPKVVSNTVNCWQPWL